VGILANFLDEALPGHPPEWSSTLTSALGGVVSTEPVEATWELAKLARRLKPVGAAFTAGSLDAVRTKIADPHDAAWAEFARAWQAFVAAYGFRGQGELDPATPDWSEDPTFVLSSIRAQLSMKGSKDPAKRETKAAARREKLEAKVEQRLPEDQCERFRELLDLSQQFVRERELTKANLARTTRAYRAPVLELGRRFAEHGLLAEPDDAWFLRLDELREAVDGELTPRAAKGRVAKRREEWERLQHFELPVVFTLPVDLAATGEPVKKARKLNGQGVSPGTATGRARVILSAEAGEEAQMEDGDILVAPFTDTAWTPLFWPAGGVVVERGSMLSHASTVARELGLPAVVAVANATRLIPDGATVTVDGSTGEVTVGR
jgi:pyruvate,water dikinase